MSRLLPIRLAAISLTLALLITGAVRAAPGDTERASLTSTGAQAKGVTGGGTGESALSGTGRFVAFESTAPDLVPGDTNSVSDIFVRDRQTGTTTRVSVDSAGGQASGGSTQPDISTDGRVVVFWSTATNLVPKGLAGPQVYVHDRETGTTSQVGPGSYHPAVSGDGRFVAFESAASSLVPGDTNHRTDIFVYDRVKGGTTRVSLNNIGRQGDGHSSFPDISQTGRWIAFQSYATNLVPGDHNGFLDVFLHDMQAATTIRVSVTSAGGDVNNGSQYPAMDPLGRFVAFQSSATNVVPADTSGGRDIYLYERETGATTLVSVNSNGAKLGGHSEFPAISAGGRFVAFTSGGVVDGDTNSYPDVLVHDRQTGYTALASTSSAGVVGNSGSSRPAISAEGFYTSFWSYASNLVSGDTNNGADVFVHHWKEPPASSGGGTADLTISKTVIETPLIYRDPSGLIITYEISVTNLGPNEAHAPVVTDNLPTNTTLVRCDSTLVSVSLGSCVVSGNTITVNRLKLAPNTSAGFRLVVRVDDWVRNGTPIDNTATVTAVTADPTSANNSATATWTTPVSSKRPLIFVPGVGGSKLVNNAGEQWIATYNMMRDPEDRHLLNLRLAPDGASPYDPNDPAYTTLRTGDILRWEGADIYQATITKLTQAGYRERVDLFPFANDWRKDLRLNGQDLLQAIDRVRAQTGAAQVDILAHSQGGLITLVALENTSSSGKVNKALTLGTPVLGATKALGMLEYQAPCFLDELPGIGCPVNQTRLQEALTNWPGGYALLPSRAFHQAVGSPLVIDRDINGDGHSEGARSYQQWSSIVRTNRNSLVLDKAEALHEMVDTLNLADPTVQLRRYIGVGVSTPIYVREHTWCILWLFDCRTAHEIKMGDGDGTVPTHSADLYNPKLNFDRRGGAPNTHWDNVKHQELPIDPDVLQSALTFFQGTPTPAETAPLDALDGIELESIGRINGHIGINAAGHAASTARVVVPASDDIAPPLNVLGRLAGEPEGVIWQTIPGGKYNAISETQSFFLNEPGAYTAKLRPTEAGPVRLRVRGYAAGEIETQAVFNVDAPANARLELDFATAQDPATLRLRIDVDGNGSFDQTVAPDSVVSGAAAADTIPPVTMATITSAGVGGLSVSLTAQDQAGGSGVAATYYLIVGTHTTPQRYTGPFPLPVGQLVRFGSIDRSGNTEVIQQAMRGAGEDRLYLPFVRR